MYRLCAIFTFATIIISDAQLLVGKVSAGKCEFFPNLTDLQCFAVGDIIGNVTTFTTVYRQYKLNKWIQTSD